MFGWLVEIYVLVVVVVVVVLTLPSYLLVVRLVLLCECFQGRAVAVAIMYSLLSQRLAI
jgi:chromate transport protein ChrA